jgi:hypothetical protein
MADVIVKIVQQRVGVSLRGGQGPRGAASGALSAGSVGAAEISNNTAEKAAIHEKLLVRPETNSQASGVDVLEAVTTGVRNTGFGYEALKANTGGSENTAFGYLALNDVTGGVDPAANYNTAFGSFALASVTTGYKNTGIGRAAGDFITTGYHNTAVGYGSFHGGTTGVNNTAIGFETLHGGSGNATTAQGSTGVGWRALYELTTGDFNTALGTSSLGSATTGVRNTAIGVNALYYTVSGGDNTAIGYAAGITNTGSGNIFIGQNADANAGLSNVTVIGTGLTVTTDNTILLGNGQDVLPGTSARDIGTQAKPWNFGIFANSLWAHSGTAVPAGGTNGAGFLIGSGGSRGIFFGSGAPTLSAAQGSLYLRTDGSGTNNRMYVNTDSGTTWTAVTTAA